MRRRRRTALVAGGAAFLIVLALGFGATGGSDYLRRAEPAPPEALEGVRARNEKAAVEAAARMREDSEQRAEATDAELARTEAVQGR
ncbi:MAG: hypothetical protein ACT4N8_00830 [Sphingosinicella sp.]|uniref:hypothetical protein n=1 Tax=Sphingosinicella sp. TaxID=1917971 RepID=UPI0040383E30